MLFLGGQSIHNFDYAMSEGVAKSFRKIFYNNLSKAIDFAEDNVFDNEFDKDAFIKDFETDGYEPTMSSVTTDAFKRRIHAKMIEHGFGISGKVYDKVVARTFRDIDKETYQAMEALVHNLCSMHSRAGSQVPFSSINYGTDTTPEGRMAIKNILLATDAGLGDGETAIFPIHVFRELSGVNYNPGDPNYDLWKLACKVSAKRLFPNFMNIDAPFNKMYYKGTPDTLPSTMGCRTRVVSNVYDPTRQISVGRGNCSFTSLNLPRFAIDAVKSSNSTEVAEKKFYAILDKYLEMAADQLYDRLLIQGKRLVKNFPFLMEQGIWIDSDKLKPDDQILEIIKHGSLSIGFIGLAETLTMLYGKHHGESKEVWEKGYAIIKHMREFTDHRAEKMKLNYSLLATPAEGLSGKFVRMDKKKYGIIKGVTDKEYYTNSFQISAYDKIRLEAPFHALCNAGHISYIELDGSPTNNIEAFEALIRAMHDANMGYYSINHKSSDRCPVCGFVGLLDNECPECHALDKNVHFERLRRITGYLVGTLDRFNNAKKAEERDRVTHGLQSILQYSA